MTGYEFTKKEYYSLGDIEERYDPEQDALTSEKRLKEAKTSEEFEELVLMDIKFYSNDTLLNILTSKRFDLTNVYPILESRFILTANDANLKKYLSNYSLEERKKILKNIALSFPEFAMQLLIEKRDEYSKNEISDYFSKEELIDFIYESNDNVTTNKSSVINRLIKMGYSVDFKKAEDKLLKTRSARDIYQFTVANEKYVNVFRMQDAILQTNNLEYIYLFGVNVKTCDKNKISNVLWESRIPEYMIKAAVYFDNNLLNNFNSVEDFLILMDFISLTDKEKEWLWRDLMKKVNSKLYNVDSVIDSLLSENNEKHLHIN